MTVGEFAHVTQFYETVLTAFIMILVGTEIITLIFRMDQKLSKQSLQDYKKQQEWLNKKLQLNQNHQNKTQQNAEHNQLEKSVTNYVQNQITNMEKMQQQQKEKHKQHQFNSTDDLPPSKQNFYKINKAFNNFVNYKMAILMPLLILGILTYSTYIYTLAAFFFSFLCQVLIQVLESQQKQQINLFNGRTIKSWLKILQVVFIMSIFISYWAVKQFDAS